MSDHKSSSSFPATQRDISQLKQTATDAASDLVSTAGAHADKAKSQIRDLAGHVRTEGSEQFSKGQGKFCDVLNSVRDYAVERPLTCMGAALAVGFLIGLSRRRTYSRD